MVDGQVYIDFWLDNAQFAARTWWQVPRVGDLVMLGPVVVKKAPGRKQVLTEYRVTRVVWGIEEENPVRQAVAVDIERNLPT